MWWLCDGTDSSGTVFTTGTVKKLHTRSAGPFQILKLNDNTYVIDLSQDFGISSTFNIEDLVDYKGPDFNPSNPLDDEPSIELISERPSLLLLSNILSNTVDQIDKIVNDEIITIKDGETRKYLIRCKEMPPIDDSWIDRSELQKIDPDILEQYESSSLNLTESSFFILGRMMWTSWSWNPIKAQFISLKTVPKETQ